MLHTSEEGKKMVDDVSVVREYPNVFPEDLPILPPVSQGKFWINFVPSGASIAKAPYQLAPPEMQEFSTKLQELLHKEFIMPSSSP